MADYGVMVLNRPERLFGVIDLNHALLADLLDHNGSDPLCSDSLTCETTEVNFRSKFIISPTVYFAQTVGLVKFWQL